MERMPCEFFLVRYVPDVVKGEFVNIGVLLREAAGVAGAGGAAGPGGAPPRAGQAAQPRWQQVRFTRDWSRVRCIDADADTGLLESLEQEIAGRLRLEATGTAGGKAVVESFEDALSNSVQISEARASLAENMTVELEQLMRMYVEPLRVPTTRARAKTGRAAIQAALRTEFERAQVWPMMRKRVAAAAYTRTGDPLKLDCGYRAGIVAGRRSAAEGELVRMFQAVSLEGEVETAKVLAYSAPQLRDGVRRVEGAELELTAVVEPLRAVSEAGDEAEDRYRFGVEAMERQQIRVITLSDLARAAETAKWELGL